MSKSNGKTPGRRAIFVLSQKGGVGKTTWCRAWLDAARASGLRVAAFDADGQVGQLVQYYGTRDENSRLVPNQDPFTGVGYFDVRDPKQRDMLVNASDLDADVILMDMPGGSVQELDKVLGDGSNSKSVLQAYVDAGYEPVVVVVINHMIASIRTVGESVKAFGDLPRYVVVKNLGFAEEGDFVVFDGFTDDKTGEKRYGKAQELLSSVKGEILTMPRMEGRTYALLDVDSMPFSSITALPTADRLRVKNWVERFRKSLSNSVVAP